MMKPQETPCIKHILKFYIGNRKGVASTLNKAVLKYPIQLLQTQCKGTAVCATSNQIYSSLHKEKKSFKG